MASEYNSHPLCANGTMPFYNHSFLVSTHPIDHPLHIRFILSLLFFLFSQLHVIISPTLFIILHNNDNITRMRIRPPILVIVIALALFIHSFLAFFPGFAMPVQTWIYITLTFFVVAFCVVPVPIRLFNFYGRYVLSQAITKINIYDLSEDEHITKSVKKIEKQGSIISIGQLSGVDLQTAMDISHNRNDSATTTGSLKKQNSDQFDGSNSVNTVTINDETAFHTHSSSLMNAPPGARQSQLSNHSRDRVMPLKELLFLKFLASPTAQYAALFAGTLPLIIGIIVNFALVPAITPSANCYGVRTLRSNTIILSLYGTFGVLIGLYCGYLVRQFPDPFGIGRETRLYSQYGGLLTTISYICSVQITNIPVAFSFDYLISIGINLMLFFATDYQIYRTVTEKYSTFSFRNLYSLLQESVERRVRVRANTKNKVLGNGDFNYMVSTIDDDPAGVQFMKILNDPKETEEFEKFLISEFSAENLRMYIECRKWEKMFFDFTDSQRRARANRIITHFVEIGSIFEVNIPDDIRRELQAACSNKKVPLSPDLFARCQNEMLGIMYDAFQRFDLKRQSKS